MTAVEYKVSYAVCTGGHHRAAGLPCQDKIELCREEEAFCVALADGAGSRASSGLGAECVTRCAARMLSQQFDKLWTMEDGGLAGHLIGSCLHALEELEPPLREMASTLMFFAGHRDGRYLTGHLGDGVQILVQGGRPVVFSYPENGAYQNETFFVTSAGAEEHLRLRRGRLDGSGALLLMSDGAAEALYQRSTGQPAPACGTIAGWLQEGDEETVGQALERNMQKLFARHSEDDLSLAVVAWEQGLGFSRI